MSSMMESLLDKTRLADCASNEAAEGIRTTDWPMPSKFWVQIKAGAFVRLSFPVMGANKVSVQRQHEGVTRDGEQVIVLTEEQYFERADGSWERAKDADLTVYGRNAADRAARLERPSEFERAAWGNQ
jgi:hypothetical protein